MSKEYISEKEGRRLICEIGRRMFAKNFVAANDGNISVLLSPRKVLCTPTGTSKGFMEEEDLIIIDMQGSVIRGHKEPSSEMKMHLEVYKQNPNVSAVVHAHPVNATALAVAGIPLTEPILTESVVVVGEIPLAPYATAGTNEVADAVRPFCKDYNGALLANHGAVVWAEDLMKAWYRIESLEQTAEIFIKSKFILGNANVLTHEEVTKLKDRYNIK
ncbi:MAG: class II aldolase/adducin family protein [Clostridiales bacterium]|nr:class II aldolase/adducin family protein [Clostridiales bacterium]